MHQHGLNMAKAAGLNYDFDKAVVANYFDAHRLIQFAKTKGLGDEAEEQLFKAYFTEGKDMCDTQVLLHLAKDIGLNESEASAVIHGDAFTDEVKNDIYTASQIGVTGVPFFVFNRKYAVSGAQPSSFFFLDALQKTFAEFSRSKAD